MILRNNFILKLNTVLCTVKTKMCLKRIPGAYVSENAPMRAHMVFSRVSVHRIDTIIYNIRKQKSKKSQGRLAEHRFPHFQTYNMIILLLGCFYECCQRNGVVQRNFWRLFLLKNVHCVLNYAAKLTSPIWSFSVSLRCFHRGRDELP